MRPADAVDIHTDLAVRLDDMRMCRWIQSWAKRAQLSDPDVGVKVADQIQQAGTIRVAATANEEIYRIARSFSDTDRVDTVKPPMDYGLLVFEDPLNSLHVGGYSQYFHMISWGRAFLTTPKGEETNGYTITTWCDANRGEDTATAMLKQRALATGGSTTIESIQGMTGGFFISNMLVMLDFQQCGPMSSRLSPTERKNAVTNGFDPSQGGRVSVARLLMAVWKHADTPESRPPEDDEPVHVPRTTRKRAQRAGLSGDVSVIEMRRPSQPVQNPGSGKPLDHQVTVREHYRHYWVVDKETGERTRVRRKISEHSRGPEGTPVVTKARVYNVR